MTLIESLGNTLAKRASKSQLRKLTVFDPSTTVDFSSNDFLSLSTNPEFYSTFLNELKAAPKLMGSGGSRLLDGNSTYIEDLEKRIAQVHGAPAGLLYNSGFDANVSIYSCIPQPGDIILYDEYIHASAHDGMRLSRKTQRMSFVHNSMASFESNISRISELENVKTGKQNVFIGIESVYSMDGDIAPLRAIVACMKKYLPQGNGYIIVDEAHATGVIGPEGKGLVNQYELENEIFLRVHTYGKAMSASGGESTLLSRFHSN